MSNWNKPSGASMAVSSSQPESGSAGDEWLNPDNGVLSIYYGDEWHPVPPVRIVNEASTFAESDVTLTHNSTKVSGESIAPVPIERDRVAGGPTESSTYSTHWFEVTPNEAAQNVQFRLAGSSRDVTITATRESDSTQLYSDTLSVSSGEWVTVPFGGMAAGTTYRVDLDWPDQSLQERAIDTEPSEFTWNTSVHPSAPAGDYLYGYDAVRLMAYPASSDSIVEWPAPADLESWDLATFQGTANSGSVTVDVEDDAGNVLFADIGQNFDISTVDVAENVRLRANFSATPDGSPPSLDYAARRYLR